MLGYPIKIYQANAPIDIIWEHKEIRSGKFYTYLALFIVSLFTVFYFIFVNVIFPFNVQVQDAIDILPTQSHCDILLQMYDKDYQ